MMLMLIGILNRMIKMYDFYEFLEKNIKTMSRKDQIEWYVTMFPRPTYRYKKRRAKWFRHLKDFVDGKFTVEVRKC